MGQISPFEWAKLVLDLHYSDSISSLILVGRPRGRAMSPDTSSQSEISCSPLFASDYTPEPLLHLFVRPLIGAQLVDQLVALYSFAFFL
jgi:hypothetical protein